MICHRKDDPVARFTLVKNMIGSLGLPITWKKVITLARVVKFLGIVIDLVDREVRIPSEKIEKFLQLANETTNKKYISIKTIQSSAGHMNHLSKGVKPAGLFLNQILPERCSWRQVWTLG